VIVNSHIGFWGKQSALVALCEPHCFGFKPPYVKPGTDTDLMMDILADHPIPQVAGNQRNSNIINATRYVAA